MAPRIGQFVPLGGSEQSLNLLKNSYDPAKIMCAKGLPRLGGGPTVVIFAKTSLKCPLHAHPSCLDAFDNCRCWRRYHVFQVSHSSSHTRHNFFYAIESHDKVCRTRHKVRSLDGVCPFPEAVSCRSFCRANNRIDHQFAIAERDVALDGGVGERARDEEEAGNIFWGYFDNIVRCNVLYPDIPVGCRRAYERTERRGGGREESSDECSGLSTMLVAIRCSHSLSPFKSSDPPNDRVKLRSGLRRAVDARRRPGRFGSFTHR
jgi:hypothetical protein